MNKEFYVQELNMSFMIKLL